MHKVVLSTDYTGWHLKEVVVSHLNGKLGFEYVVDLDRERPKPGVDYPEVAEEVANRVADVRQTSIGILVGQTGIEMAMAANKVKGVRATPCFTKSMAVTVREENDSNVLCLGWAILANDLAVDIVNTWLNTPFLDLKKHRKRLDQVAEIEAKQGFLEGYIRMAGRE